MIQSRRSLLVWICSLGRIETRKLKKIDLGQLLQILANVGVIAGIVFLAVEIRQSNRIAIATTEIEIRNNWAPINSAIYSDQNIAELLVKCREVDPILTEVETEQAIAFIFQWANSWLAIEEAYKNGMVSAETFATVEDDIRLVVEVYPGLIPFLRFMVDGTPSMSRSTVFQSIDRIIDGP